VFFSSFSIKIPKSSKRQSIEKNRENERENVLKKKKRKEKGKLQESLQIKRGSQYFERIKTFQLQNLFT
jgi:hypothetical protein